MIGVIGTGSWGTALAAALAYKADGEICIWGREPEVVQEITQQHTNNQYLSGIALPHNLRAVSDLAQMIANVRDILLVVPSNAFSDVLEQIKPHITSRHRLVWATKGLDAKTGKFLHQIVESMFTPQMHYAVLAGPSFAREVAQKMPTAVTIAVNDEQFGKDLQQYFHSDTFRVYLSDDVIGAQVGGVIKNILAVAAGLSDGLGFGANARAALITRGLAEMMRFGVAFGAKPETLQGLAGVGDVILTCTDNQSRNRRFGLALAADKDITAAQTEIGQIVEAVHNAAQVCKLAKSINIEMPIAQQVYNICNGDITPRQAVQNLLTRKPIYE